MVRKKRIVKIAAFVLLLLLLAGAAGAFLLYRGVLQLNNPSASEYPVRGVDVSAYQGEIDWEVLSRQGIRFAFIKATEGSGMRDERFSYNWEEASKTRLRVGAYHFFSFDSPGQTQADLFIQTVSAKENMLPPVVDIEFYGDKEKNPPEKERVKANLKELLTRLEEHYGVKPILYATAQSYDAFLKGDFSGYDLWFRSVVSRPSVSDGRAWKFWQYSNRMVLDGYSGRERYIDMNLFSGSVEEFEAYATKADSMPLMQ